MKRKNLKNRMFCLLLTVVMLLGTVVPAHAASVPFTDVPSGVWYTEAVSYCYSNGLMSGTSSTKFEPNQPVTRAMTIQVLYNMEGATSFASGLLFEDVEETAWYAKAVTWGYYDSVVRGTSDKTFSPDAIITREQVATMFYNYRYREMDLNTSKTKISQFSDYSKISSWAKEAMAWAVNAGLLSGVGNNRLDPKGTANRAQLAQILKNYSDPDSNSDRSETESLKTPKISVYHTYTGQMKTLTAKWLPVPKAEGYILYIKEGDNGTWKEARWFSSSEFSYESVYHAGAYYYFKVKAYATKADGTKIYSNESNVEGLMQPFQSTK